MAIESLLFQFLMPDNDARRQAEDQINVLTKDPQVIPELVHHLLSANTPIVRQLSAALLRKKITGHWAKLSPQLRQLVKESLIESITMEHSPPVRRASADVVSIIAKFAVPAGEWPDLLPFLFQCSQSAQEDHREVALILFSSLIGTLEKIFRRYLFDLQSLLLKCLKDETSNRMRVASLKAVGSILEITHNWAEVVKFRECIPSILNVSRQCLASGEEDVAVIAFEIFDELIEVPIPLPGKSLEAIVQFSFEVCSSQNLGPKIRHQAIQTISWLVKYKCYCLKRHKLVIPILQVMCPLLAESTDRDDKNDLTPDRAATDVIDTMALTISKLVFPHVLEFALLYYHNIDPKFREASVTSLGVISEGCLALMKDNLETLVHIVLGALRDPEQMVRTAVSWALGQFSKHLQPEIVSQYKSVLPCILTALEDASDEVKEKSYYALAEFCKNLKEEILPLGPLMGKLLGALQNSPRNLQVSCMSAIGSVASAAKQAFVPYAERVLELMKNFMVLTNDEDLRARARATELVGITAILVGRMRMEPIIPPFIEAAISGFGLEFSELREYTHGFCSNVAKIMDDGFAQYLPHVIPLAFYSCNLDDGSAVDIDNYDEVENSTGFGGVSSDDEAHDKPRVRNISISTGVLDEKAAATQAIGLFALHSKSSYAPYLEESQKILVRHSSYFHEDVRLQAIIALKYILTVAQAVFQGRAAKAKEVLDTVMNIYIKTMTEDDNKEVVAQACMNTTDIIKDIGYMTVQPSMPQIVEATLVLLRGEAACQKADCLHVESDSDEDDDEDAEHDVLMDAVSDLLPAFAKSMGCHFAPIFAKLFERLMKFAKASRPPQDRTMVVACLAKVAQDMGAPIADYIDAVMPLVLKELASPNAINRRNAAFCAVELCKNGGEITLKHYGDVLHALYPLFGESEPDDAARDEAVGAVASMIKMYPESIPLNKVLPVFLKVLPLKDHEESMAVYDYVCNLVLASNPQISSLVPDLVYLFAQFALSPVDTPEVKSQIGRAFSHLISLCGHQMQPILSNLPPTHANALAAIAPDLECWYTSIFSARFLHQ